MDYKLYILMNLLKIPFFCRSTVDEREQKQLLMDLEVVMNSNDCPYIVLFYGAIFKVILNNYLY